VYTKSEEDISKIIQFTSQNKKISITPRTEHQHLGQTVGEVCRCFKIFYKNCLAFDKINKTLNRSTRTGRVKLIFRNLSVIFGPNTLTSNRCMMGGIVW
jgi:hypothetical protein